MALKDQPYLPLYIQDVLTDEKLIECSASSHGVYFRLLCLLHKQEKYGLICLKQKYKQNESKYYNFAMMLSKQMPFDVKTITDSLIELSSEKVITISEDDLFQKRMVRDGELSITRTEQGKKGGSSVTKQYGKDGFLYLMSDGYDKHKIGISVNPQGRLYRLRCDLKLPKHFEIIEQVPVNDMGKTEDLAHLHYGEKMDGEWIDDSYENVLTQFALFKANIQAKPKANDKANPEDENEDDNTIENIILLFNKKCIDFPKVLKSNKIREKKIKLRLKEMQNEIGIIEVLFDKMQASEFLKGKNNNQWSATFDWVFENESNWVKVIEGNYDNKKSCIKPEKENYVDYNARMAAELIEEIKQESKDGIFTNPY